MSLRVPLQNAPRQTLAQRVVDEVTKFILANGLREGDPLPGEREMCAQLGVSRSPLREGLRALQALGAVDIRHGKGAFVGRLDVRSAVHQLLPVTGQEEEMLLDLLEIRETLEMAAITLAIPRMNPAHLEQLRRHIESAEALAGRGVPPVNEDLAFHEVFFVASQNRVLISLAQALREPLRRARELYFARVGASPDLVRRHAAVYEAIAAGQDQAAINLMAAHLREATAAMLATLVVPVPARPGEIHTG